jgi:hypothetical protein
VEHSVSELKRIDRVFPAGYAAVSARLIHGAPKAGGRSTLDRKPLETLSFARLVFTHYLHVRRRSWDTNVHIPAGHLQGSLMFAKELVQAGHTRRFVVAETSGAGWEIREEQDSRIVRRVHYTDWHRVERALSRIRTRVSELEAAGWRSAVEAH